MGRVIADSQSAHEAARLAMAEELAAIWIRHRSALLARIDAIDRSISFLDAGDLLAPQVIQAAQEAHRLAGTIGSFGHDRASALAQRLDDLFLAESCVPSQVKDAATALRIEIERLPGA